MGDTGKSISRQREWHSFWTHLSPDSKASVITQGVIAGFAIMAFALSTYGVIEASEAADEANRNQIESNQLVSADKVSWYFGRADPNQQAGSGQYQLRIENHGLVPAINVLLWDPGQDWSYYYLFTLAPCTRYLVNFPLAIPGRDYSKNVGNWQFQFLSAGRPYRMASNRSVVKMSDAEAALAASRWTNSLKKGLDVAHRDNWYKDYKDLAGCA
ncbi:hypothetical protein [Kitasatospora sp. HPMI-4]|uniref:hypothetical protein n=1 Tax=Kitasatospora sp. HPMI-4 TaxID=3448443 RepID=UPI003F1C9AE7